jgi:indole-3-glycerol phosphate synthase/phosphoribosylanthranilate isomerase
VGVFQNHRRTEIADTARTLGLKAVQLHGDEDEAYIDALRAMLPEGVEIWKAVAVADALPALPANADRLLFDTKAFGQSGGTGQAFDWSLLATLDKRNLMLAGGLNPDNAARAAALGCRGLDFNSGVESAPGQKDPAKLDAAFAALRHYGRRNTQ